jgi:putative redox protein
MNHKTEVSWKDGLHFEASLQDFKIEVDADKQFGGQDKGPTPKPLVLVALGGCTGMDVVSILNKMKIKFDHFTVEVSGETEEEHPKIYKNIKVKYTIKGDDIPYSKLKKAVDLSTEKYCAVNAMLSKSSNIEHEITGEGIDYDS